MGVFTWETNTALPNEGRFTFQYCCLLDPTTECICIAFILNMLVLYSILECVLHLASRGFKRWKTTSLVPRAFPFSCGRVGGKPPFSRPPHEKGKALQTRLKIFPELLLQICSVYERNCVMCFHVIIDFWFFLTFSAIKWNFEIFRSLYPNPMKWKLFKCTFNFS